MSSNFGGRSFGDSNFSRGREFSFTPAPVHQPWRLVKAGRSSQVDGTTANEEEEWLQKRINACTKRLNSSTKVSLNDRFASLDFGYFVEPTEDAKIPDPKSLLRRYVHVVPWVDPRSLCSGAESGNYGQNRCPSTNQYEKSDRERTATTMWMNFGGPVKGEAKRY